MYAHLAQPDSGVRAMFNLSVPEEIQSFWDMVNFCYERSRNFSVSFTATAE